MTTRGRKSPAGRREPSLGGRSKGQDERLVVPKRRAAPARKGGGRNGSGAEVGARRRRSGPVRTSIRWLVTLCVWGLIGLTLLFGYYAYDLPDISTLKEFDRRPEVSLVDSGGARIATYGHLYGTQVRLEDMPKHLPQAIIAIEDRRFHDHFGVDPMGLARAMLVNIPTGGIRKGGSTITQQLAKVLFLTHERSMARKVREFMLALWLEQRYSKQEILTIYLNRVYFGAGAYGVDAAARRYFGRPASEMSLYQSALLAGLLRAPSRLNPVANPKAATRRAELVLSVMAEVGFVTEAEVRAATRARGLTAEPRRGVGEQRYFADWVMEQVPERVNPGDQDLVVTATLSPTLQRLAERHVARLLSTAGTKHEATQAAVVLMAPDGAILAMVGGRSYRDSQFNRATRARRQPGSSFKTFVLLAAIEAGLRPDDRMRDAPVRVGSWRPRNHLDRYFGDVTLREGMARSLNSVAVRVSERVGRDKVVGMARRLGVPGPFTGDAAIALGVSEVTVLDMAAAYAVLANGGHAVTPYAIREIATRDGRSLYRRGATRWKRVLDPRDVAAANNVLNAVMVWGTGRAARFDHVAAGKTGTTDGARDAWFVGYTAHYVAAVWVGNDDARPMKGVTGGGLPAQLWRAIMRDAHAGRPHRALPGVAETD